MRRMIGVVGGTWLLVLTGLGLAAGLVGAQTGGGVPHPVVDSHAHLMGKVGGPGGHAQDDFSGAASLALETMDRLGITTTVVMPPPLVADSRDLFDAADLAAECRRHPGRLVFLAGGGSLNPMLQQAAVQGDPGPELRTLFEKTARDIAKSGARGFGEMTALHFSFRADHPFEQAQADHPLLLLLADLAAELRLPMDLHLEAVAQAMDLPPGLGSPPNPARLEPTLPGLERLLAHNRGARIIWAHAGWDNTGVRTPQLCRDLLARHPNLYMSFKLDRRAPFNRAQDEEGRPRAEWVDLLRAFPDRFILGSDHFHLSPRSHQRLPQRGGQAMAFLRGLPPELARMVAWDNPRRLFALGE